MLKRSSIVKDIYKSFTFNDLLHSLPRKRSIKESLKREGRSMTICVAALCNNSTTIFGASDRMITSGDVEFEPPQQKIWKLTDSIVLMVSGDIRLHADFYADIWAAIQDSMKADASRKWLVKEIANIYLDAILSAHAKMTERELLHPLGATLSSFLVQTKDMAPEFARQLADKIWRYPMKEADVIVAGADRLGCHIYVIEDGELTCRDPIGFAAIGAGYWHANSHLMFSKHTRFEPGYRAIFRTYAAKKRAEVAPGIGQETDMFAIGNQPPQIIDIDTNLLRKLSELYAAYISGIDSTGKAIDAQLETTWGPQVSTEQQTGQAPTAPPPQSDSKNLPRKKKKAG